MKKWIALPMAALMLAAMAIPSMAQDMKKEARTVMLKESNKAGTSITEKKEEANETTVSLKEPEMVLQNENKAETGTKVTDILTVDDAGKITSARVTWTEGKVTTEASRMGQPPADPVEEEGVMNGVSILYTWNADKKAFTAKVEKGDAEDSEVKKEASKKQPFANAFVPGREVKVGESWEPEEQALKDMMGEDEGIKLESISATCTAEEIVTEDGVELLRVSLDIKMTAELQDEGLGKPKLTATRKGSYYWNIKEARATRVELKNEGGFEAEVNDPQAGKMDLKVEVAGTEAMTMTYAKTEAEDGDDDGEEDDDDMK